MEDEYDRIHAEIWPEMVDAMRRAGFSNYSLFRRGQEVIAVCECYPDVRTCYALFESYGVGQRWSESTDGVVLDLRDEHGELVRFDEVWHLD